MGKKQQLERADRFQGSKPGLRGKGRLGQAKLLRGGGGWLAEAGDGGGTGSLPYQAPECSLKSHPMNSDQRHEKMQH